MTDFLAYRIPGEERVERTGTLKELHESDALKGFIFSDFSGKRRFQFIENNALFHRWHLHGQAPSVIDKRSYMLNVEQLVDKMRTGVLKKVVYSRVKKNALRSENFNAVFLQLTNAFPNALVYLLSSEIWGTWMGASPELLLFRNNTEATSVALAGTKVVDDDTPWSAKELKEHTIVSEYIEQQLQQVLQIQPNLNGPAEVVAGPVKHLQTTVEFTMNPNQESSFLASVHPTPAISGDPVALSMELIEQFEVHDRGLYAGFFGSFEENQTYCFVNLRCCRIIGNEVFLYVGGGITAESNPNDEWEETESKSLTLTSFIF
jgi:isochorismate synthase